MIQQLRQFIIQPKHRNARTGHFHAGGELANEGAVDAYTLAFKLVMDPALQDVQLFQWCRTQAVNHDCYFVTGLKRHITLDGLEDLVGDMIGAF